MQSIRSLVAAIALCSIAAPAFADDFPRLNAANPVNIGISAIVPLFDFDGDGCLPSAGISRSGQQNGGLATSGSITGGCRRSDFLNFSNTLHRYACINSGADRYCVHFFSLYFLKDQATVFGGGHRHDWEHVAIWTRNGATTHAGYSAHGDLFNKPYAEVAKLNGRVKFVYHKDGALTHAMRFASSTELPENPYGAWVLPAVTSWYTLRGDGTMDNAAMRSRLNSYDYGSATIPMKDTKFLSNINNYRPTGYPLFTQAAINASL